MTYYFLRKVLMNKYQLRKYFTPFGDITLYEYKIVFNLLKWLAKFKKKQFIGWHCCFILLLKVCAVAFFTMQLFTSSTVYLGLYDLQLPHTCMAFVQKVFSNTCLEMLFAACFLRWSRIKMGRWIEWHKM